MRRCSPSRWAGPVVVVTGPKELPWVVQIIREAERAGGLVVTLTCETTDMRATVEHGLKFLETTSQPAPTAFLVAPADCPRLSAQVINDLIAASSKSPNNLLVPTYQGKRGHPVLVPWRVVPQIKQLPFDQGLNAIVNSDPELLEITVDDEGVLDDLDTPEDYERLKTLVSTNLFGYGAGPLPPRVGER